MQNDIIALVTEMLNKRYGAAIQTDYYANVRQWLSWWRGYDPEFHAYTQIGANGQKLRRRLYSMHMAKRICEDWAAVLLNEKTTFNISDENSSLFLQGEDGTGGVLGYTQFWHLGNELVEKAFATGTGAFVLRVQNASFSADGRIKPDSGAKIGIEYLDAMHIIPISVKAQKITEAAFVSEVYEHGKKYVYVEEHTLDGNGNYVIRNSYYRADDGGLQEAPLPPDIAGEIYTGSDIPWFAIVRPNIANNCPNENGLGISVYGNAMDALRGVDLAYNNTNRDIYLGGKKVFYNKSMLATTPNGGTIAPDDVIQQLFQQIGDDDNFDAQSMIQEFNPTLRAQENRDSVQAQLDYLSFLCGLGTHRYQFNGTSNQTIKTATEYHGNKQELVQMAAKHMILIEAAIKSVCRCILYIGAEICGEPVDPEAEITVNFEDGYIVDDDSRRERDRQDVRDGLMSKWEYRVKWYGESEEEARAWEQGAVLDLFGGA